MLIYRVPLESSDSLKFQTDVRMITRTNKPEGAVLYIGENSAEEGATFMALGLDNGTLVGEQISCPLNKNIFQYEAK